MQPDADAGPGVLRQESSPTSANRRPDIQGLRAVAVLMVVVFHARLPFPGGFVGVDVFFVISGFVITAMLHREWMGQKRLDFAKFYKRRFQRLTPALSLMVTVVVLMSVLFLSPQRELQTLAKTALGTMLLSANFVIAKTTGDYFDSPAEGNPLLNTWSLSVEEQFYLIFPLVLLIGWTLMRRSKQRPWPIILVSALSLFSFACAMFSARYGVGERTDWLIGFYGPLSRIWEFGCGALLALAAPAMLSVGRRFTSACGLLGAVLLAASLWLIDGTTPFPGPWTLLPVVGTVLVLIAGTHPAGAVPRLLSTTPMVKVGDWSYSIYLWHWPCIVFAVIIWPDAPYAALLAALVSFLPAIASYQWVEMPLRGRRFSSNRRFSGFVAIVVLPPIVLAGAVWFAAAQYWGPANAAGIYGNAAEAGNPGFFAYLEKHAYPCTPLDIRQAAPAFEDVVRCQQSKPGDATIALLGDSHAEHLYVGLAETFPKANVAYYIQADLPLRGRANFNRIIDHIKATPSIRTVIVNAYWAYPNYWSDGSFPTEELAATLNELNAAGKQVFITDDIPNFPFDPSRCGVKPALLLYTQCTTSAERIRDEYSRYAPMLAELVERAPGTTLLESEHYFCDSRDCSMVRDGKLIFRDINHLSVDGSRYLIAKLIHDNPNLLRSLQKSE